MVDQTCDCAIMIANSKAEGYIPFWGKNWPQNCEKQGILHTLQANGENIAPLATLLSPKVEES